jgi:phage pi2 protein 07
VLLSLAADDEYRADLFTQLDKAGRSDLFPASYRNQEAMARANLVYAARYEKPSIIQAAGKKWVSTPTVKGYAWFFKYKLKDESAWLMAISGVQPEKTGEVNGNHFLVTMTNRKLTDDSPEQQQFDRRLQQLLLSKRKSALRFFQASTALR